MSHDLEAVLILLQRQYNCIQEIWKLTRELEEACYRNDEVSASMLLQMREDEMRKYDSCEEEIWSLGEQGGEEEKKIIASLSLRLPASPLTDNPIEKQIHEIKNKTKEIIEGIKIADRRINRNAMGERSYYADKA